MSMNLLVTVSPLGSHADSEQLSVDLKACTDVRYEKSEGVHGVVVQHNSEQIWSPVYARRRKSQTK